MRVETEEPGLYRDTTNMSFSASKKDYVEFMQEQKKRREVLQLRKEFEQFKAETSNKLDLIISKLSQE